MCFFLVENYTMNVFLHKEHLRYGVREEGGGTLGVQEMVVLGHEREFIFMVVGGGVKHFKG